MPAAITVLGKEAFVEAAWAVVGRKVAKARLLGGIYETAQSSTQAQASSVSRFVWSWRAWIRARTARASLA